MRTPVFAVSAVVLLSATARAQTGSQPMLVISMYGGVATGNHLWSIGRQPLDVLCNPTGACGYDTLYLSRDLTSGIIAGVSATYFKNPHVGLMGEVFYLGMPLDDGCTALFINADPGYNPTRNQVVCDNIAGASLSTSALGLYGGVVLRASATHVLSPYVRGGVGVLSYSSGTVEMSGLFADTTIESRAVIIDPHEKKLAPSAEVAAGFTARLGPGYQFRFELRDLLVPLEHVTGAAPVIGCGGACLQPPTDTRIYHRIAFTLGLDVVLEQKRGRRY
jgi:hypothetical protein